MIAIYALRYDEKETAGKDFDSGFASARLNCGVGFAAGRLGHTGFIHCQSFPSYEKIFWKDYWIVGIIADDTTEYTAAVLVDIVRDAIASRWEEIVQP